jgi:hypothetical protein
MYLDVISCKDYDNIVVKETVEEFIEAKHKKMKVLTRQAPLPQAQCMCLA